MLVKQILTSKDGDAVLTVRSDAAVSEAAAILSAKRVGTVVVSDDGGVTPHGILSERDIVRVIGTSGPDCMTDPVSSLMTAHPVTCAPTDSADQVLTKMTDGRFRHLPVIDGGAMIGLISIGDVVKARLSELDMEKTALEDMVMGR